MTKIKGTLECDSLDGLNDTLVRIGYSVLEVIEILEEFEEEVIEKFDKGDKIEINILEGNKIELKLVK